MTKRIKEMEAALDAATAALRDLSAALEEYESVADQMQKLEEYYDSGAWRDDFEPDEAGLVPPDLKRGVLSEDALYDMLMEHEEVKKKMREVLRERYK